MIAWSMSSKAAEVFYTVCAELKANTEEERVAILTAMAKLGMLQNVVKTTKTKEEYLAHLQKNFKVKVMTPETALSEQDDQQEK